MHAVGGVYTLEVAALATSGAHKRRKHGAGLLDSLCTLGESMSCESACAFSANGVLGFWTSMTVGFSVTGAYDTKKLGTLESLRHTKSVIKHLRPEVRTRTPQVDFVQFFVRRLPGSSPPLLRLWRWPKLFLPADSWLKVEKWICFFGRARGRGGVSNCDASSHVAAAAGAPWPMSAMLERAL